MPSKCFLSGIFIIVMNTENKHIAFSNLFEHFLGFNVPVNKVKKSKLAVIYEKKNYST